ncbi:MAG TPA: hypothetical protein VN133_01130, partial [Humibacter sp.]|nr:hypothetical protein [Humibacter sp.]
MGRVAVVARAHVFARFARFARSPVSPASPVRPFARFARFARSPVRPFRPFRRFPASCATSHATRHILWRRAREVAHGNEAGGLRREKRGGNAGSGEKWRDARRGERKRHARPAR